MNRRVPASVLACVMVIIGAAPARAQEPFRYPEAKHGGGELRYVNGVPVLRVEGTPEQMGTQLGVLALKPAVGLTKLADQYLKQLGWEAIYPVMVKMAGTLMVKQFPPT